MKFDLPTELSSIIKVIGVGGGGSNAVNHMYAQGIRGVDFIICNTDKQALDMSPVPVKLQLGPALTEGLGAGARPERGKGAAEENLEEIRQMLSNRTKMVFITAGMGGGTGTGAAPVIASVAREMGILTVGIVTMPFSWEGRRRRLQANSGVDELRQAVDTLLVINNDRLRDLFGNLTMDDAFAHADNVLTTAARGIAEIITTTGKVNVDFEDVRTVMTNSGAAIMGMAEAEGADRALNAATAALSSPLLNDSDISGAKYVLLNIAHGEETISMDEMTEITDHIQDAAGLSADVIWGYCMDASLPNDRIRVTVIATGFSQGDLLESAENALSEKKRHVLDATQGPTMLTGPITDPLAGAPKAKAPEEEPVPQPYLKTVEPVVAAPAPAPVAPVVAVPPPTPTVASTPVQEQSRIDFNDMPPPAPKPVSVPQPAPAVATEKVKFELYAQEEENTTSVEQSAPEPVEPARAEAISRNDYQGEVMRPSPVEHQARVDERLARMREMSLRLRTPNGLADMEREPAFKRKNVALGDGPRSMDSNVSRYTLSEGVDENGDRRMELKRNNPYLHDNVD